MSDPPVSPKGQSPQERRGDAWRQGVALLLARAPVALWTTDRELLVTSVRGVGTAASHLAASGATLAERLAGAVGRDELLTLHRAALEGAGGDGEIELDGRVQRVRVEPLRGDEGTVDGCVGVAWDVSEQREAERARAVSDVTYRELLRLASDAILLTCGEGRIEIANARAHELFGYPDGDLVGRRYEDLVDPADLADVPLRLDELRTHRSIVNDRLYRRRDGSRFRGEISARVMPDGRLQGIVRDVTERRRTDARLRRQAEFRTGLIELVRETLEDGSRPREAFFRRILDLGVARLPGAQAGSVLVRDERGRFRFAAAHGYDEAGLRTVWLEPGELEWDPAEPAPQILPGFRADQLTDPERRDRLWSAGSADGIRACLVLPVHLRGRFLAYLLFDNFERSDAFEGDAVAMGEVLAQQVAALLVRRDLEARLRRLAYADPLTGLPNRPRFTRDLDARLARDPQRSVAVVFLDLDDFGVVNDLHGHELGDELLVAVAERLAAELPTGAALGRWGGDEFLVALSGVDERGAGALAHDLAAALAEPFDLASRRLHVRASVGWEIARSADVGAAELIRRADTALMGVKRQARGGVRRFDREMERRLGARRELEDDLRLALVERALEPHYQPRVDLATGRATSVEALARWHHPQRGAVSPGEFIPLAEANGTIGELGRQMLDAACAQAARWRDEGTVLRVAVNVSALQLADAGFAELVRERLARHRLDPHLLELEITESVAMGEVQRASGVLERLHRLGVALSIDDFGTAYSSLARLRELPVRSLKIDRSFVTDLGAAGDGAQVARAVVSLARSLGLTTIAEGIETEAQALELARLGCDEGQGWLYARAMPPGDLEAWLRGR